jgi:hypothetical protein
VILVAGGMQQFTAMGYDIDDHPISNLNFNWNVVSGGGIIDSSGIFIAGFTEGSYPDTVVASFGGIHGVASVEVFIPVLDHFTFEPIGNPVFAGTPFQITIAAHDVSGNQVVNYSGQAALSDSTGTIQPIISGSFINGLWTGEVEIGRAAHDVNITANDSGVTGMSESLEVLPLPKDYQVTSIAYDYLVGEPFQVTITAYAERANFLRDMALAILTISSNFPTMLFDADGDGIFGEPDDNIKFLVGDTFDIMARDTTAGTGVTIVATDKQGLYGYNTFSILSVNYLPFVIVRGP